MELARRRRLDLAAKWVTGPAGIGEGYIYDPVAKTSTAPPAPPPPVRVAKDEAVLRALLRKRGIADISNADVDAKRAAMTT